MQNQQFFDLNANLPIIDLKDENCPKKLREICENIGFFYVKNNLMHPNLINDFFEVSKAFFRLPDFEKLKYSANMENYHRGYVPWQAENLGEKQSADTKEAFHIGRHVDLDDWENKQFPFHGPNVFPPQNILPANTKNFKEIYENYQSELLKMSSLLTQKLALSMGLEENFFEKYFDRPNCTLRIVHYEALKSDLDKQILACGAHTDFGFFTLLKTDKEPGLQVFFNNDWFDVPPLDDCFVVNIADMLKRWTNDTYKSTLHRVVNQTGNERFSNPFFYQPNWDAVISVIDKFVSKDQPKKYEDITMGEHHSERFAKYIKPGVKE